MTVMRKHVLAALFASSALLIALVPAASAAPLSRLGGAPDIDKNSPTGYYIWHTDDGFRLRTNGPAAEQDFDAVLRTNGTFENVDVVKLEGDDRVDVVDGGHKMIIHFHSFDLTDGVNFTVRDGERLRFRLKLDDKRAPVDQIFLGAKKTHPKKDPFGVKI